MSAALIGFFSAFYVLVVYSCLACHGVNVVPASRSISTATWILPRAGRTDQVGVVVPRTRAAPLLAAAPRAGSKAGAATTQDSKRVPGGS